MNGEIEAAGASMVVISPQLKKYSKQISKKLNLTFPVLSDQGNKVAASFGLVFELPNALRKIYSEFGIDLERFNGNDSWTLPMSGRFIIDNNGRIINVDVDPDYIKRPEPEEIITILKERR